MLARFAHDRHRVDGWIESEIAGLTYKEKLSSLFVYIFNVGVTLSTTAKSQILQTIMIVEFAFLCVSVVLLYFGADSLVSGSSRLGLKIGLSPLVVGLTVVAFGTSLPEFLVSVQSALQGLDGIAVGNVVGSNIFNIGVILGISACITPQKVNSRLILRDVPFMVIAALLVWAFLLDGRVLRTEGFALAFGIILYTWYTLNNAEKEPDTDIQPKENHNWGWIVLLIAGGLFLLLLGSTLLIENASALASAMGISEAAIGLTVVAAGTSMPELATSVVAAIKKQPDIAIGNVVGSNIFNAFCILGVSSTIHPLSSAGITNLDIAVMVGLSLSLWPILWTNHLLNRWEGGLLVFVYGLYLWVLWP